MTLDNVLQADNDVDNLVKLAIKGATLEALRGETAEKDPLSYTQMLFSLRGPLAQLAFELLDDVSVVMGYHMMTHIRSVVFRTSTFPCLLQACAGDESRGI